MKKWKSDLPGAIAVIHLPPLIGAPGQMGVAPDRLMLDAVRRAKDEARLLSRAGFQAVIIENFGDVPFYASRVPPETIASMSVIALEVRKSVRIPVGINVLRNDALAAHAIALATAADFIRVNVLSGVSATDQGVIEGPASALLREKVRLNSNVRILADIQVKHARSLSSPDDWEICFEEVMDRAGADGVIVTGPTTGRGLNDSALTEIAKAGVKTKSPWWVGSGLRVSNIRSLVELGGGFIVGSALRKQGKAGFSLDSKRLTEFRKAMR